jgi:hypothetical protein
MRPPTSRVFTNKMRSILKNWANLAHWANSQVVPRNCPKVVVNNMVKNFWDRSQKCHCNQLKAKQYRCPKLSHQIVPKLA